MGRCRNIRIVFMAVLCATVAMLGAPLATAQATSASYRLPQMTTNTGGFVSRSASFVLTGSAGQEATIGTSSVGASFVLQSGFWSFLGSGLLPVILSVEHSSGMPGHVDLSWSGNNAPYTIYQSANCGNVYDSAFTTTSANSYSAIPPLPSDLVCFNVLATAPGIVSPGPGSLQ